MLTVKASAQPSKIHGIGLIADERIPKGTIDDSRFTNHSKYNNIDVVEMPNEPETCGIANRDIEKGEELLVNYREFDTVDQNSNEEYLNT